jgi:hypothetical protein
LTGARTAGYLCAMRALLAVWLLLASLALPAHGHDAAPSISALDAACAVCIAAHQLGSAAPAPLVPDVVRVGHEPPLAPDAALPAPLDAPAPLGRAPPLDPARA